ncbi:Diacylglycerol O-acyltransferase 2 [Hondaea fermentalgiana]|uniref:Acyltransferase n=1 Tax=Hondaea fermentalgiana TaxID=2315210 RepID=A0A2R5GVJ5_9STRA|nr:Diacylglycerol O-acyltransferase 2 [Hondaea fermentalgiana]|eukprot:GBG34349.1 Diacylglycerol O-acyltransferase 2 [Hondaea fermentalgiana]
MPELEKYYVLDLWRVPRELLASKLPVSESDPDETRRKLEDEANELLLREYVVAHEGPFPDDALTEKASISAGEQALVLFALLVTLGGPLFWFTLGLVFAIGATWQTFGFYVLATLVLAMHPLPSSVPALWTSKLINAMYKYFSYRFVWKGNTRQVLRAESQYLGSGVPHGVMPFANLLAIPATNSVLYRGCNFWGAPASVVYRTPFLRYLWMLQCCDVGRESIVRELAKGHSVGLVGDGIAGIFQSNHEDEVVALKNRKGLAKLALRTGTSVLPCYSLGNTAAFSAWFDRFGIMEWLSRKAQASIFLYWGRFGLPIPHRVNITMIVGDLIKVDKATEQPTTAQVDALHEEILAGFQTAFDSHKSALGWGARKLRFV